ncbi:MAG: hypothetical protein BWX99_01751 [Deltaproteobacteria bacterium ADurb.Bin151]|nr:MAG: hypothetical protein BWX99_01751 [Deltaproteobacteria bacterium ADurb.Bin151]
MNLLNLPGNLSIIPFQEISQVVTYLREKLYKGVMHAVKVFPGIFHLVKHFIRDMIADKFFVTGKPVMKDMLGKFDQQAVAFNMGLLSKKINQRVFAEGNFIYTGGDVA